MMEQSDKVRSLYLPRCESARIVVFPQGERGHRCIQHLLADGQAIVGVTLQDGSKFSTRKLCESAGISTHWLPTSQKISTSQTLEFLRRAGPDLIVLAGFDRILPASVLSVARVCTLNLHAGPLPEYRGASIIQWQIINGEPAGGCTIHVVDDGIDTGPIVAEERFAIGPDVTGGELVRRTLEIFPSMLSGVLQRLAKGTVELYPQDENRATYYRKRRADDNLIKWESMRAVQVHNLVRALSDRPIPRAFTYCDGRRIEIHRTNLYDQTAIGPPGRVVLTLPEGVVVMCADQGILVSHAEPPLHRDQQLENRSRP